MDGVCVFSSFLAIFILSCQVFGFQKTGKACNSPLGIQNGHIPDSHFSASSYYNLYTGSGHVDMKAKYCRLNHKYAWCTRRRKREQSWLKVDLGRITNVTAISTQGYTGISDYYVKSFKLAYSINGSSWKFIGKDGIATVFVGNKHGDDTKTNNFDQVQARYIKIFPVDFSVRICLRIELYGCVQGSSISSTTSPTTISTSKISSSAETPTTINLTPTPSKITTSMTTKATRIKSTTTASVNPSTSSKSTTIATSPYTTGIPSYQHSTAVPSSQSVPTTSSYPSEETSAVAMTESIATLISALHRKHARSDDEKKKNVLVIGFSILGGLLMFVIFLLLFFSILRRSRKRVFNISCQLVDLGQDLNNSQVDLIESIGYSPFVPIENDSTLVELSSNPALGKQSKV